jgi:cell migration-inducing and hyaluronan-binding protein
VQPHDAGPPEPVVPANADRWSDPDTWDGRVPTAGQDVVVPVGQAILLDVDPPALGHVRVEGELYLDDTDDRILRAASILVTGRLSAGSASRPFTHRAEIVLDGADSDNVAGMGAHVLGVKGGILDLHGAGSGPTWTRLASTATPASTRITLTEPVAWRAGDRIVLAATDLDPDHAEEATVAGVDGSTVTLTAPLQHTHWASSETYGGRTLEQRAEVGLLSHPIVVRGADDAETTGMGGQIRVEAGSTARLSRVELARMGQAGVMGRYPFHFHLMGSAPASYLRDSSVHHSANRCVTVHGTLDALVANVVAHESQGHCFFLEDGVETGNRFYCNLGSATRKPEDGKRLLESDQTPATFWISNPTNDFVGNAAAGADGNGFWYDLPEKPTGSFATSSLRPRQSPMGTFADNVAHSNRSTGWKTGNGLFVDEYEPEGPTPVIRDFSAWRNGGFGVWNEHTRLEGASLGENGTGFLGRHATLANALVVGQTANGAERQWSQLGVAFYVDASHIEDVHFANFRPQQWKGPMRALGHHSEITISRPSVARLSFENADVLQIDKMRESELHRSVFLADLDGSVAGFPAVLTADHPLLAAPGCRTIDGLAGVRACPTDDRFGFLRVGDRAGEVALEPATVTRADGLTAAVNARDHSDSPRVETTVRLDQRYRLAFGSETPAHLSVVLAGTEPGWAEVTIPWSGPAAFVYRPWDLGRPLPAAPSVAAINDATPWFFDAGTRTMTLRMRVDQDTVWAMADVCRTPGCA